MRGMARASFLAALVPLAAVVPAVALASSARVVVKPGTGSPSARFTVRFTAPDPSGHVGVLDREYVVTASGPSGRTGCLDTVSVTPRGVKARARVRVTLSAKATGARWCRGRWNGTVEEFETPYCPRGKLCPLFVSLLHRLGRFHFTVGS